MSEVVAFPTAINYSRLYRQASSAHASFIQLGKMIELGEVHRIDTDTDSDMNIHILNLPAPMIGNCISSKSEEKGIRKTAAQENA